MVFCLLPARLWELRGAGAGVACRARLWGRAAECALWLPHGSRPHRCARTLAVRMRFRGAVFAAAPQPYWTPEGAATAVRALHAAAVL